MNTQKKSACESALSRLRTSLKKAILNEEVEMTFSESSADGYYAEMRVNFGGLYFDMTIAKTFVCYHNPFTKGMFDKKKDFEALTELVNKHVKILTPASRNRRNQERRPSMKRVINAVVRIEYEQDDNSYYADMSLQEKDMLAIGLAIHSNFVSEECGIGLRSVHIEPVEPYQNIDWDKLEHNPEQIFINE